MSIKRGMEAAELTADSFQEINAATEEFTGISHNMARVVEEQKKAVSMVTQEVDKVLEIANTNQQLARETDETAAMSLTQAEELGEVVAAVKLKEGDPE